jgi:tetratricopeptide (TPR) repeat protein
LDAPLFYELLLGEIALRQGDIGAGFQQLLGAARHAKEDVLFRRAIEIAIAARAPEQALNAAKMWRDAVPKSREALEYIARLQLVMHREAAAVGPLKELLALSMPQAEQIEILRSLPRMFATSQNRVAAAAHLDELSRPYMAPAKPPPVREAAWVVQGQSALWRGNTPAALNAVQQAVAIDFSDVNAALLAVELMPKTPEAEPLVRAHLAKKTDSVVNLPYVQALIQMQRLSEASTRLEVMTKLRPDNVQPWLALGALQIDLHQPAAAQTSLKRCLALLGPDTDTPEDDANPIRTQAYLLLAQAAQQLGDYKSADVWLNRVDDPKQAVAVQSRRALLLAKQGKVTEARDLLHKLPERQPDDARAKLLAEVELLRLVKRFEEADRVLDDALRAQPEDADFLYEKSMIADRLGRPGDMEQLLRRVIKLKPNYAQAYNALGYSFADRGERLDEARALVGKALSLAPSDPFIIDSMGWVEFRSGHLQEALKYLRQAWDSRPDAEIGAHLGEVLWMAEDKEEALRIWRQSQNSDEDNELLKETLLRLQVGL